MTIKLCAFELDYVLWNGRLDASRYGKGHGASKVLEDNLRLKSGNSSVVEDWSNTDHYVTLNPDVSQIFHDIHKNGIQIAITSSNGSKKLCDRALWLFNAPDKHHSKQYLISFVKYDENNSNRKVEMLKSLREWSGFHYKEMAFFDLDCTGSQQVQRELDDVNVRIVDKRNGLTWKDYSSALKSPQNGGHSPHELPPYTDMPSLGRPLGSGKFADVYRAANDSEAVVKKLKHWKSGFQQRFISIYKVIDSGHPFKADPSRDAEDERFLSMIAVEYRNLRAVGELKAPKDPERFCGWFSTKYIRGTPVWEMPPYSRHPFSVPFQQLLRRAFHLAVDQIEAVVQKSGIEHRDAHLANIKYTMDGDKPVSASLLDWGFGVRMKWDGRRYIRGNDVLVWNSGELGAKYTPEEFRKYWIEWMVKTEYEAQMSRQAISRDDGRVFLKDLTWWFER